MIPCSHPPASSRVAPAQVPFVTVVTDLGSAHPHWFDRRVDACFVPSEALRRQAKRRGLSDSQIRLHGLPIRPTFWQSPKGKYETRRALGLKTEQDTVLVVGGGDGVGDLGTIVTELAQTAATRRASPTQIVVVCGRNKALCRSLQARQWPPNVRVVVHGFVSQMSDFMAAADVLITKAGPGTIAEASARGLPIVLSSFLPGQEAGNVPYVTEGGFGSYRRRVSLNLTRRALSSARARFWQLWQLQMTSWIAALCWRCWADWSAARGCLALSARARAALPVQPKPCKPCTTVTASSSLRPCWSPSRNLPRVCEPCPVLHSLHNSRARSRAR